jgi:hypothetical protein
LELAEMRSKRRNTSNFRKFLVFVFLHGFVEELRKENPGRPREPVYEANSADKFK